MKKMVTIIVILLSLAIPVVLTGGCTLSCPPPQERQYDLIPVSWSYKVYEPTGEVWFYPIIENIGTKTFCGNITYTTGIYAGQSHIERTGGNSLNMYDPECKVAPYWSVRPGERRTMDYPLIVNYHHANTYSDLEILIHPEGDQCPGNNDYKAHFSYTGAQLLEGVTP